MSQGISCKVAAHRSHWFVTQRNQRCSAFDGYHAKWSEYSAVYCPMCPTAWRTKSAFVGSLPDAPKDWHNLPAGEPWRADPGEPPAADPKRPAIAPRGQDEFYPAFLVPGMNPNDWKKKK